MTALIVIACVVAYLACGVAVMRQRFTQLRPYREPLSCQWSHHNSPRYSHNSLCYQREGSMIASESEAAFWAFTNGLVWPVFAVAYGVMLAADLAVGSGRDLPEEVAAKVQRLEAENERLRRQQEGRPS